MITYSGFCKERLVLLVMLAAHPGAFEKSPIDLTAQEVVVYQVLLLACT